MLCSYCMNEIGQVSEKCPHCGKSTAVTVPPHMLVPGTVLCGRYIVGIAKGEGGFGITYIGKDTKLDRTVAVKEYFPSGIVNRNSSVSPNVTQTSEPQGQDAFRKGRERFLNEARTLAKFTGELGIVNVIDFFEENSTAYIVMEYLDGISLGDYIKTNGVLTPEQTLTILMPVMLSLEKVHKQGLIHRDISPSNIMILKNTVKLIDFGAARNSAGDGNRSLSLMLKPGYAPEEQYRSKGEQGPWTDVYALCATIYKCITGITPDEANDRLHKDELKRPSELGVKVTPSFEAALMKGLSVLQQNRYQSVQELVGELSSISLSDKVEYMDGSKPADVQIPHAPQDDDSTRCISPDQANAMMQNGAFRAPTAPQMPQQPFYPQPQMNVPNASQFVPQPQVQQMPQMPQNTPFPSSESSEIDRRVAKKVKQRKRKKVLVVFLVLLVIAAVAVCVVLAVKGAKSSDTSSVDASDVGYVTAGTDGSRMIQTDASGGRKNIDEKSQYASFSNTIVTPDDIKAANGKGVTSVYFSKCQIPQETIDSLSVMKSSLKYLSIVECAGFGSIKSLSELSALTSIVIQKCDLSNECVNELDISKLPELHRIELLGVPKLSDISFISKAGKKLSSFEVSYCDISDISPVSNLDRLYTFKADNNKIKDISALKDKNITSLSLSGNKITDLSPLQGNKTLSSLDVSSNEITSIDSLADCSDLKQLNLNHNKLTGIGGAQKLIRLEKFECSDNQIPDISGLTNCTVLKYINISSNKISDISLLSKSSESLYAVFIDNNQISDLSALSKATGLKCLSFNNNKITSLDAVKDCTKLTAISGDNNGIESLEPISAMTSLSCISFAHNKISDMTPLKKMTASMKDSMYVLDLSNNQISQIELASGKKYQSVLFYNNPLKSLDSVKDIKGMTIAVSYFDGIDLKELKKGYFRLSIVDCPLDKQMAIEKEVGRYSVSFVTAEEIEKDTNSKKEAVFKRINS